MLTLISDVPTGEIVERAQKAGKDRALHPNSQRRELTDFYYTVAILAEKIRIIEEALTNESNT